MLPWSRGIWSIRAACPGCRPSTAQVIARAGLAHNYDVGKPQIAWGDSEARVVLVDALVRDVVALLVLIAGQDVEPAPGRTGPPVGGGSAARSPQIG